MGEGAAYVIRKQTPAGYTDVPVCLWKESYEVTKLIRNR
jgi:hypothetical protein